VSKVTTSATSAASVNTNAVTAKPSLPATQAVSHLRSRSRSLLGVDFGDFGSLFAAPSPPAAASVDAGTLDIPDLNAISSMLDKLEGKTATAPAQQAVSAASSRTLTDSAQLPVGAYRQESYESQSPTAGQTLSGAHAYTMTTDGQHIRRHKHRQEPQEDPNQYMLEPPAYAPQPEYQPPSYQPKKAYAPKPDPTYSGDAYAPQPTHQPGAAYRGASSDQYRAPPPVQFTEPAPAAYPPPQQQYDYQPQQPRQKVVSPPGPEYEQGSGLDGSSADSYKPKRLQRSWAPPRSAYGDAAGPSSGGAEPGPGAGGLGGGYADEVNSFLDGGFEPPPQRHQEPQHPQHQPPHQQQQGQSRVSQGFEEMPQGLSAPEQPPQRFKPGDMNGGELAPAPPPFQPPRDAQPGSTGPALVFVTNTAREKGMQA
jgi:hypothetical protein